jgi:hypothetical protein
VTSRNVKPFMTPDSAYYFSAGLAWRTIDLKAGSFSFGSWYWFLSRSGLATILSPTSNSSAMDIPAFSQASAILRSLSPDSSLTTSGLRAMVRLTSKKSLNLVSPTIFLTSSAVSVSAMAENLSLVT